MPYQVPADQNLTIDFAFQTASGKPAKVQEGSIKVASSDEAVASLILQDGVILVITNGPGTITGTISGDADIGEGETLVSQVFDVTVTPLNAESIVLGEGKVVPK
jgi:hypothetical protein